MSDKPSYLGLLNAIAVGESRAHTYLTAWANVTPDPDVAAVLRTVAAREGEHGMTFARRVSELGYTVRERDDPKFADRLAVAASDRGDLEKMKALGLHKLDTRDGPDIFDDVFKNHSIDIRSGELLGRYIAEERDSARLLRCCYEALRARAKGTAGGDPGGDDDRIASLDTKVDALCRAVEDLRQIVCAQSMPAGSP